MNKNRMGVSMAVGVALGVGMGATLGSAMHHNMGEWVAIGAAMGIAIGAIGATIGAYMDNNKRRHWVLIGIIGLLLGSQVFEGLRLLSPAMMIKWVLIGVVLIALGIFIGVRMKKTYVIKNKFQWRVWVLIGVIGLALVVGVGAPLHLLGPKMVVEAVLMGMTLIALGISIGAVMKYKAEID